VLRIDQRRVNDIWGQPHQAEWSEQPDEVIGTGMQDCVLFTFTALAVGQWEAATFKPLLQADIRNADGRLHNYTIVYNEDDKPLDYKGMVHNPTYEVPLQQLSDKHRKYLYVASEEMHCVIRYAFSTPADPQSSLELSPRGWDSWWLQDLHLPPYSCIAGECFLNDVEAPEQRDLRPGENQLPVIREPPDPTPGSSDPKTCRQDSRKSVKCGCQNSDDCVTRDDEICWSDIGGPLQRAHTVFATHVDPDVVYVTAEGHGHVVQVNASSGEVLTVSPRYGHHITGLGMHAQRHDYGSCQDNDLDTFKHCTGADGSEEDGNMPTTLRSIVCDTDADCNPEWINSTYLAVESANACDYQAVLRHVNRTERLREVVPPFDVLESEAPGRFQPLFDGWLRDRALKYPYTVQYHAKIGVLVSSGSKVLRYDPHTGDYLQTLVDLSTSAGEEGVMGDITCFHVE